MLWHFWRAMQPTKLSSDSLGGPSAAMRVGADAKSVILQCDRQWLKLWAVAIGALIVLNCTVYFAPTVPDSTAVDAPVTAEAAAARSATSQQTVPWAAISGNGKDAVAFVAPGQQPTPPLVNAPGASRGANTLLPASASVAPSPASDPRQETAQQKLARKGLGCDCNCEWHLERPGTRCHRCCNAPDDRALPTLSSVRLDRAS